MEFINFFKNNLATYNGLHPDMVKGKFNFNNLYQKRYLLNKIYSKFNFDFGDLKEFEKNKNTFRFHLFALGSVGLFNNKDIYFSRYSIKEWNMYYNPYKLDSHLIGGDNRLRMKYEVKNAIVNKDCVIVKSFDDYLGFSDILNDYAETLASFDKAIKVALLNANVNLYSFAKDRKQAEEIKNAYAMATQGEPLVILDKGLEPDEREKLLTPLTNHDTTALIDRLLTSRRMVVNNFLTEIGINNANLSKKERLNSDEVNANDEEIVAVANVVLDNIKQGFDTANKIFGTNLSVELNEEDTEEDIDTINSKFEEVDTNV